MSLNIIFAGTPLFACEPLKSLLNSKHKIKAVFTQPDRQSGRGRHLTPSPVKQLAALHNIPVYQPRNLKDLSDQALIKELSPDVFVVVAYGVILPPAVLTLPKYGCINVHASLLPHFRGAAPIQHALLAGHNRTGVTIMQMDAGLDTGDMLLKRECVIHAEDTSDTLLQRLSSLGAEALLDTLDLLEQGLLTPEKQDNQLASYAPKITKEQGKIDWKQSANFLNNQIRAYNPWPVAFTHFKNGDLLRIWAAEPFPFSVDLPPGTIYEVNKEGIDVATGEGLLRLLEIQLPGGKRLSTSDLLHSKASLFKAGDCFI